MSTSNIDVAQRSSDPTWALAPGGNPAADLKLPNYLAGATVNPARIVKFGADVLHVIQGAAATDALFGVYPGAEVALTNDRVYVQVSGVASVEAGAAVTLGALVTADSVGRAVAAAPAAGVNNRVIGIALEAAGAAGDFIDVLVVPHQIQGA